MGESTLHCQYSPSCVHRGRERVCVTMSVSNISRSQLQWRGYTLAVMKGFANDSFVRGAIAKNPRHAVDRWQRCSDANFSRMRLLVARRHCTLHLIHHHSEDGLGTSCGSFSRTAKKPRPKAHLKMSRTIRVNLAQPLRRSRQNKKRKSKGL